MNLYPFEFVKIKFSKSLQEVILGLIFGYLQHIMHIFKKLTMIIINSALQWKQSAILLKR